MYDNLGNEELVKLYQENKSNEIMELLIKKNTGIIGKVAKRFSSNKTPYEDMFNEGVLGLIINSHKYNPNKGAKYTTFIEPWIFSSIQNRFVKMYYTVNVPYHVYFKKSKEELSKLESLSLNQKVKTARSEDMEFVQFIEENHDYIRDAFDNLYYDDLLKRSNINNKYKDMFRKYFGINQIGITIKEISDQYNCSKQYIRQCLVKTVLSIRMMLGIEDKKVILNGAFNG